MQGEMGWSEKMAGQGSFVLAAALGAEAVGLATSVLSGALMKHGPPSVSSEL